MKQRNPEVFRANKEGAAAGSRIPQVPRRRFNQCFGAGLLLSLVPFSASSTPSGGDHRSPAEKKADAKEELESARRVAEKETLNKLLLSACYEGNAKAAEFALDNGADIESLGSYKGIARTKETSLNFLLKGPSGVAELRENWVATPLLVASKSGRSEVVQLLISRGANLEAKDGEGNTALINAAFEGEFKSLKLLVEAGADLNAANNEEWTALLHSALGRSSNFNSLKLLVENGADLDASPSSSGALGLFEGWTALMFRADDGDFDSVKFLVDNGADVHAEDSSGNNALLHAFEFDSLYDEGKEDDTVLLPAPDFDNKYKARLSIAKLLLDKGIDVNSSNNYGETPLTNAAEWGMVKAVKLLLKNKADANLCSKSGETPLIKAMNYPDSAINIARMLLAAGADINAKCAEGGNTALMFAVSSPKEVAFLLKRGADVHLRNDKGETALVKAIADGHEESANLLRKSKHYLARDEVVVLGETERFLRSFPPSGIQP